MFFNLFARWHQVTNLHGARGREFEVAGWRTGLKVVSSSCAYEGTSYSLVQTLAVRCLATMHSDTDGRTEDIRHNTACGTNG